MPARATDGTCLAKLVRMAIPICRAAQSQCPRTGPGRTPEYDDWKIAVLIMTAIVKRRKSKSAQYRFLWEHRKKLQRWLGLKRLPTRSTYFARYRRAHRLWQAAIVLQGKQALEEKVTTACIVAVDKSLVAAKGTPWHGKRRCGDKVPPELKGVDRQADWGYSPYHNWVYGYSYEIAATADPRSVHLPLAASAGLASASEHATVGAKIDCLPGQTRFLLADSGYDSNAIGDRTECEDEGVPTGRRFLCPPNRRNHKATPSVRPHISVAERAAQERRKKRIAFYQSPRGKALYAQRGQSVEPLHDRLKSLFDLDLRVWHRGLDNNKTQLLATIFCYQLLLRFNHRCGYHDAQVQWILEAV